MITGARNELIEMAHERQAAIVSDPPEVVEFWRGV
jgi:hypothetical protein